QQEHEDDGENIRHGRDLQSDVLSALPFFPEAAPLVHYNPPRRTAMFGTCCLKVSIIEMTETYSTSSAAVRTKPVTSGNFPLSVFSSAMSAAASLLPSFGGSFFWRFIFPSTFNATSLSIVSSMSIRIDGGFAFEFEAPLFAATLASKTPIARKDAEAS